MMRPLKMTSKLRKSTTIHFDATPDKPGCCSPYVGHLCVCKVHKDHVPSGQVLGVVTGYEPPRYPGDSAIWPVMHLRDNDTQEMDYDEIIKATSDLDTIRKLLKEEKAMVVAEKAEEKAAKAANKRHSRAHIESANKRHRGAEELRAQDREGTSDDSDGETCKNCHGPTSEDTEKWCPVCDDILCADDNCKTGIVFCSKTCQNQCSLYQAAAELVHESSPSLSNYRNAWKSAVQRLHGNQRLAAFFVAKILEGTRKYKGKT